MVATFMLYRMFEEPFDGRQSMHVNDQKQNGSGLVPFQNLV